MKCPNCRKTLWETETIVSFTNKKEKDCFYQCPVKLYWCADGCSMDVGCGYSQIEILD